MNRLPATLFLSLLLFAPAALAGNTSSNSSSNSSNGVHTRVDTIITDERGQTIIERRSLRIERDDGPPAYLYETYRESWGAGPRRWRLPDDD